MKLLLPPGTQKHPRQFGKTPKKLGKTQKKFDLTNQVSAIYNDSKLFGDHWNS